MHGNLFLNVAVGTNTKYYKAQREMQRKYVRTNSIALWSASRISPKFSRHISLLKNHT